MKGPRISWRILWEVSQAEKLHDLRSQHRVCITYRLNFLYLYEWILKPIQWNKKVFHASKLSVIYVKIPKWLERGYTSEKVSFARIYQIISMYGYYEQSHVSRSLLHGWAFILGTSWIIATVSCNIIGSVPRTFEITQSKSTVYRFMLDQWITCIYLDPDEPFLSGLILDHEFDPDDHFFWCETPKMRHSRYFWLSFSNIGLNPGVSRWDKQELYKIQLWWREPGEILLGYGDFLFDALGSWASRVWSRFWPVLNCKRSETREFDYSK